jgi:hypothetical protein
VLEQCGWLDATLTLHYHVSHAPASIGGVGPGYGFLGGPHDYQDFLRVYVPRGAQLQSMRGVDRWAPAPAYGLTQFAGRLLVREDRSQTVTLRYLTPASALATSGRYSLTVRRQPGTDLSAVHALITATGGITLAGGATSLARTLSLARDAHLSVLFHGDLHAGSMVPTTHAPIDPYIPFSDFRDPRHPL